MSSEPGAGQTDHRLLLQSSSASSQRLAFQLFYKLKYGLRDGVQGVATAIVVDPHRQTIGVFASQEILPSAWDIWDDPGNSIVEHVAGVDDSIAVNFNFAQFNSAGAGKEAGLERLVVARSGQTRSEQMRFVRLQLLRGLLIL